MFARTRARISPTTVVAWAALFVALGGTGYAAKKISSQNVVNDSLTSRDIKNASLTGKDIKDGKLGSRDIGDGQLLAEDFAAGQLQAGPQGDRGPKGEKGDTGPSTAYAWDWPNGTGSWDQPLQASKTLPPGDYVIFASTRYYHGSASDPYEECNLKLDGTLLDHKLQSWSTTGYGSMSVQGAASLSSSGTLEFLCDSWDGGNGTYTYAKLTAIKVGSVVSP